MWKVLRQFCESFRYNRILCFSQVTWLYDWQAWHCFLSSVRMGQYLLWSKQMTLESVAIAGFFQPGPPVLIYYYSHLSWLFVWSFSDLSVSQHKTLSNFLWVKNLQALSALSLKHLIAFEDKDIPTMHLFLQHEPYATKFCLAGLFWLLVGTAGKKSLPNLLPCTFIIM